MSGDLTRKSEVLANIAIAIVAILIGVVLVKNYLLPSHQQVSANLPPEIQAGEKISLPDVDWSKTDQTLLLILSQNCHFCSESTGFYQQLVKETSTNKQARLIAAFPQDVNEGKKYLTEHELAISEIKQISLDSIKTRGTPTLILVDHDGVVKKTWIGKLPPEKETEVRNELLSKLAINFCN